MKKLFRYFIIIIIVNISGKGLILTAQENTTMYFMTGIPQSYLLNPAFQPECNLFLGMPGLSSVELNIDNSALNLNDVIWYDNELQETITFLHPDADLQDFLKNFKKTNYITAGTSLNLASFGFRVDDFYFTFNIADKTALKISYPDDLINFVLEGNEDGDEFDFSGLGTNVNNYLEIGMGVSKKFSNKLTVGVTPKLLLGVADLSTTNTDISLSTSVYEWILRSKFDLNANIPGIIIPTDADGFIDIDNISFDEDLQVNDYQKMLKQNLGLAMDLGVQYEASNKFSISASVLDLGYIRWKNNAYNVLQDGEFVFDALLVDIMDDTTDFGQNLLDSISDAFTLTNANDPYTTFLNAKLYFGGRYYLLKNLNIGFLSRTEFIKGNLRQQLTFSTNLKLGKVLNLSASYSLMNNSYKTIGVGLASKLGPFNFYLISDHIPLTYAKASSSDIPIPIPHETSAFNLRFGFNLVFGCNKEKKIESDKPLIF
ncbi:MAG: hypothetical protein JXJ22_11010 [Bacteroidales bacterium]|nr:hypothetical protein [Bacteroidales bacterium]